MSRDSVVKFMEGSDLYPDITGMYPNKSEANRLLILKATERLLEEAQELYDAVKDKDNVDWKEAFDGLLDCDYVATQLDIIFKELGFDTEGGSEAVCINNELKVYDTEADAVREWQLLEERDGIGSYIVHPSASSQGVVYTVRRVFDDKVTKSVNHPAPDLLPYMPDEFKEG